MTTHNRLMLIFSVNKSEVLISYKAFNVMCKTQHNIQIKILHSNRRGEYMSTKFQLYLKF